MGGSLGIKLARIAVVAAVFLLWEALSRTGIVNPRLLPSATDSMKMLGELLQRASVRNDLVVTASEVLTAFVLAVPLGALIGFLITGSQITVPQGTLADAKTAEAFTVSPSAAVPATIKAADQPTGEAIQ